MLRDEILRLENLLSKKEAEQAQANNNKKTRNQPWNTTTKTPGGRQQRPLDSLSKTSEIRAAISTLKSEQRETRKKYKKAIATLDQALEGIYHEYEDKQLLLFSDTPNLPEDVEALLAHPSIWPACEGKTGADFKGCRLCARAGLRHTGKGRAGPENPADFGDCRPISELRDIDAILAFC